MAEDQGQLGLELGMNKLNFSHGPWITEARRRGRMICRRKGTVSSDELHQAVAAGLLPPPVSSHAWGSVFRANKSDGPGYFKEFGRKKSAWPTNHRREIRVWMWTGHNPDRRWRKNYGT